MQQNWNNELTNEQAAENVKTELIKKKSVDEFAAFDDRVTEQSLKETGPSRGSLPSAYTNRTGLHQPFQHPQASKNCGYLTSGGILVPMLRQNAFHVTFKG